MPDSVFMGTPWTTARAASPESSLNASPGLTRDDHLGAAVWREGTRSARRTGTDAVDESRGGRVDHRSAPVRHAIGDRNASISASVKSADPPSIWNMSRARWR